jgi:hypothetical protein
MNRSETYRTHDQSSSLINTTGLGPQRGPTGELNGIKMDPKWPSMVLRDEAYDQVALDSAKPHAKHGSTLKYFVDP